MNTKSYPPLEIKENQEAAWSLAEARANIFAKYLSHYLGNVFSYKEPAVHVGLRATVDAFKHKYKLYFRVTQPGKGLFDEKTLVIARINFHSQRKGHGTRLLSYLTEIASHVGYSKIGIEATNNNSQAFGKKLGFQQHGEGNDMLASVENLRMKLATLGAK